jgi:mono/diheme cytochrome c family protein
VRLSDRARSVRQDKFDPRLRSATEWLSTEVLVMKALVRASLAVIVVIAFLVGAIGYSIVRRGVSTRTEPSAAEEFLARSMRRLATPREVRAMNNPIEPTAAVLTDALEHFADHCAGCHANDGSGDTEIGRGLYPRAPDMRAAATQRLTDGELFSIIENGIRLTGMPAWSTGTSEGQRSSWALVHFVRHLPKLTDDELSRMEALNPKTPQEWRQEEEARRFLAGEDVQPATPSRHGHERSHD